MAVAKKAAAKKTAKKAPAKKQTGKKHQSILTNVETVPLKSLEHYPGNPRIGNVGRIVESLLGHGQFAPLLVQKSTNYILKGNHTWDGMDSLGWETCDVIIVDVDDDEALRIVLEDNRSSDDSTYDWDELTDLLETIADTAAERTGWTQAEVDELFALKQELLEPPPVDNSTAESIEDIQSVENGSITKFDVNVIFPIENEWGIPLLREDMILEHIPEQITTWCGPVISERDDVPGQHFVYCVSSDSTRSMPWHRTILSFYIHDQRFEMWWSDTDKYIERMASVDLMAMITPDFSMYADTPKVLSIWSAYRNAWIGRFAQEAGIKVIPNLTSDHLMSYEWSLAHVPKGTPTAAVQVQTVDKDPRAEKLVIKYLKTATAHVECAELLVYSGKRGRELVERANLDCKVIYVPNRSEMKDQWKKERDEVYTAADE